MKLVKCYCGMNSIHTYYRNPKHHVSMSDARLSLPDGLRKEHRSMVRARIIVGAMLKTKVWAGSNIVEFAGAYGVDTVWRPDRIEVYHPSGATAIIYGG